ncbi:PAS domain-containing protein [Rhizobium mesoamericanum]|uniref:sensor histidine kinase n=1 Tax=Rhizobium mesoamericanum TaxID=1079800 RepID=UPI00040351DE|nr:PAS domain-containing protein [Rhizobium mesoamericanum]
MNYSNSATKTGPVEQSFGTVDYPELAVVRPHDMTDYHWRAMVDTIPAIVWSTDPSGSNTFHNQRLLNYTGFSREEAQGWGWSKMIHPDDEAKHSAAWMAAVESGGPFECESRLRRFDGEFRWFLARAEALRDENGAVVNWYGTNIDIHDRKLAENALQRSEAYLSESLRLNGTGIFGWNASNGDLFYLSDEGHRIFDLCLLAKPTIEHLAHKLHADDLDTVLKHLSDAPSRGELNFRCRLVTRSGDMRHVHVTGHSVPNDLCHHHFLGAVSDITERVKAEELLQKLQSDFAHASRISILGELTASIAHEIAQPLSAIAANSEAGLRWLDRANPDLGEVKDLTGRIVTNVRRATDIIGRIRSMATRASPIQELVSLDELVREALLFLRHEVQARDAQILHHLAVSDTLVHADRTQIQQVIVNLLLNAMQALDGSPVRNITIRTELDGPSTVCFSIEDTGAGVAQENLPRLFESFFTTKSGGMGIGLPLCKSIIEAHGGSISGHNRPDCQGARFVFALPLADGISEA